MAYLTEETYTNIKNSVKNIAKKYGVKLTVSRERGMTDVVNVNVKSGSIDFISTFNERQRQLGHEAVGDKLRLSRHWYKENLEGKALDFATEVFAVLLNGNHDRSDSQSDYFDVGWYAYVNIGDWSKPYILTA